MCAAYKYSHLTFEQSYRKAADYCAAQEHCVSEMIQKLKQWGFDNSSIYKISKKLIEEDFINEKRFALAYARGKFRNNKWGKVKIVAELMSRHIPESLIYESLEQIEDEEYDDTIQQLAEKKSKQLGDDNNENQQKIIRYLASKGFEISRIVSVLKK